MRLACALVLTFGLVACRSQEPTPTREPVTTATTATLPTTTVAVAPVADAPSASPPLVTDDAKAPAQGVCHITLGATLAANIFRGVRSSPSRQATMDRLDDKTRRRWEGRDHGVTYVLCKYAVDMNGKAYVFEWVAAQHPGSSDGPLDPAKCSTPEERKKVAEQIRSTTKDCTDAHAGAYWGYDLVEAK